MEGSQESEEVQKQFEAQGNQSIKVEGACPVLRAVNIKNTRHRAQPPLRPGKNQIPGIISPYDPDNIAQDMPDTNIIEALVLSFYKFMAITA